MVTETKIDKVDKRKLTVLSVNEFIDNDDEPVSASTGRRDVIDVRSDSYILCFTGRRGGGKTTAMSFFGAKCMALWNMRVLSNYPIDFMLCREVNGVKRYYPRHSEPLDLYKLLCFDNDYKNCIICIDEAPDIISHMAASSWKNRLLAIFVRQLRKNNNSLMLCAQDFGLIDKSMRWQVDIEVQCVDAKKQYGNEKLRRGSIILMRCWIAAGCGRVRAGSKISQRTKHSIGMILTPVLRVLLIFTLGRYGAIKVIRPCSILIISKISGNRYAKSICISLLIRWVIRLKMGLSISFLLALRLWLLQ